MANTISPHLGTRKTLSTVDVVDGNKPMKLTRRGRVVAYFVAVTALLLVVHYLDNHYRITTCRQLAEGWTCNTTWK